MEVIKKPWGKEKILFRERSRQAKLLFIKKGQRTSLQYHRLKKEAMTLVKGEAYIKYSEIFEDYQVWNEKDLRGYIVLVKPTVTHEIVAKKDSVILEISIGDDSDIKRVADVYGRSCSR